MNRFYPELNERDRIEMLEANAEKTEERTYLVPLDPNDLTKFEKEHVALSIHESTLIDEFSELKKQFREQIKEVVTNRVKCLQAIKQGAIEEKGKVYLLIDREENTATYYNSKGFVVQSRPTTAEERQLSMQLRKAM